MSHRELNPYTVTHPSTNRARLTSLIETNALWVSGGCEIVYFVSWYIMGFAIKYDNNWSDFERPQVAMHRNCDLVWLFMFYFS